MDHLSPLRASSRSHDDLFKLSLPLQSIAINPPPLAISASSSTFYSSSSAAPAISRTSSLSSDNGKFQAVGDRFSWESDICTSSCRSSSGTSQDCCFLEGDDCMSTSNRKLPPSSSLRWSRSFSFRLYTPCCKKPFANRKPSIKRFLSLSLRLPRRIFCRQANNVEVANSLASHQSTSSLKQGRTSVDSSRTTFSSSSSTPVGVPLRGLDSFKTGHASSASWEWVRQDELKSAIAHCKKSAALPL